MALTSKDENLNKAHVQHIEARLVALANKAKRCLLENATSPTLPSMSEADAGDAEGFLCEMLLCFPVLGVSVFSVGTSSSEDIKELFATTKGIRASGYETHDGFLVRSGSAATKDDVPSAPAFQRQLKLALVENGVLEDCGSHYRFTQDYVFSSPSTAAGIVQGRSANGRVEWKSADGVTLRDLQGIAPSGEPE